VFVQADLLRSLPGKDRVVLGREIFDENLILLRREYRAAPAGAGILTREIICEGVCIPMGKLVVAAEKREPQDETILLNRYFQRSEILV